MLQLPSDIKENWMSTAHNEIKSLEELQTWEFTELPQDKHAIACKWIFKVEYDLEGNESRYKARFVAKWNAQKFDEDYEATFAPVATQCTFQTLLAVTATKTLIIKHYDVKTNFLNGDIKEDLYISQRDEYVEIGKEGQAC